MQTTAMMVGAQRSAGLVGNAKILNAQNPFPASRSDSADTTGLNVVCYIWTRAARTFMHVRYIYTSRDVRGGFVYLQLVTSSVTTAIHTSYFQDDLLEEKNDFVQYFEVFTRKSIF